MASANEFRELQKLVAKEYRILDKKKKSQLAETAKSAWNHNQKRIQDILKERDRSCKETNIIWTVDEDLPKQFLSRKTIDVMDDKGHIQQTTIKTLKSVNPIPNYTAWAPIQHNFMVDDEKVLRNIPFIEGSAEQHDHQFLEELLANYDGKIHGCGTPGLIDDSMMVELIEAVKKSLESTEKKKQLKNGTLRKGNRKSRKRQREQFPHTKIFEAISEVFPDKGDADDIRDK